MPFLTLTGVPPYDGRYELALEGDLFTIFEWGWIKRFAGYLPANVWEGFDGGDQELMATFAVIALHRAGRITNREAADVFEQIGTGQIGSRLQIEPDETEADDEGDAGPPAIKLEREWNRFWSRFTSEFGDPGRDPASYWDARLGYFGVGVNDVGYLTPAKMLGCVDMFAALYQAGEA